jgi:hypothetical protein
MNSSNEAVSRIYRRITGQKEIKPKAEPKAKAEVVEAEVVEAEVVEAEVVEAEPEGKASKSTKK